ncbi:MAG TPA: response regulator transcription factor [Candidatus Limnocylindria bacterium]|jgi:two-component system nitrate/nitrite response regulator NarL|nr:response regulator transcription factor [Candidatus Limnocylindria bacterium]
MQQRSKNRINVFLLEGHPLAGRYLTEFLERDNTLRALLCGQDFPSQHIEDLSNKNILVIDSNSLRLSIMSVVASVRSRTEMHILVLGPEPEEEDLCRLLFLGIRGFVPFERVEDELILAIEGVLQGRIWVNPDSLHRFTHFVSAFSRNKPSGLLSLTPREQLISGLLQQRLSNKEIASALDISERTVKFHVANIFTKVGVHDRRSVRDLFHNQDRSVWNNGAAESADERKTCPSRKGPHLRGLENGACDFNSVNDENFKHLQGKDRKYRMHNGPA